MFSANRSRGGWLTAGLACLLALGAVFVLCALVLGLLDLLGAVATHGRHGPIHIRPLPVPRGVLLGLVYGLIPLVSAIAILAALRRRSHRSQPAASESDTPVG